MLLTTAKEVARLLIGLLPGTEREENALENTYYRGQQAYQYNKRWRKYTKKTLAIAETMIDYEALNQVASQHKRPLRILDVACGTGILLQRLLEKQTPCKEVYGADASADMLAQAREALKNQPHAHLAQADFNQSDWSQGLYAPESFDLITCTNALHDIINPLTFFGELRNLLAPGGYLVMEDFAPRHPRAFWTLFERFLQRAETSPVHALTLSEAIICCEQSGCSVVAKKTFVIDWFWHGWALRAHP